MFRHHYLYIFNRMFTHFHVSKPLPSCLDFPLAVSKQRVGSKLNIFKNGTSDGKIPDWRPCQNSSLLLAWCQLPKIKRQAPVSRRKIDGRTRQPGRINVWGLNSELAAGNLNSYARLGLLCSAAYTTGPKKCRKKNCTSFWNFRELKPGQS